MKTASPKFTHGQDAFKVALALWLLVAPWMLNYNHARFIVWNGAAVAVVIAASSIAAMLRFAIWEEWIGIVAGSWLFASPWLFDYSSLLTPTTTLPATANHIAVGLMMVFLSLVELNLWEAAIGRFKKAGGGPPNS